MLDVVLLIVFAVASCKLALALLRESAVLAEFGQTRGLVYAVALFPLGPILVLLSPVLGPLVAFILALGCYLPALAIARGQERALQRAGTDRVNPARAAIERSFGAALVGLIYVVVAFMLNFSPLLIKSVGQGA
jgi:hypothetical protein